MLVELDVSDLEASVGFYGLLGFMVAVERWERRFVYLTRDGEVDIMLQAFDGPGERLVTASLERPFGRGVCVLVPCSDVDVVFSQFVAAGGRPHTAIQGRSYDVDVLWPTRRWPHAGRRQVLNRQFVVVDPDGYLLRLFTERTA